MRILPKILAICLFLLFQFYASGQDIITTTKGTKISATIVESNGRFIKYKYGNSEKVYKMPKRKVAQIQYADSRMEGKAVAPAVMKKPENTTAPDLKPDAKTKKFRFGISAGGGVATGRYDYITTTAPPTMSMRFVPTAGINLDWRAAKHYALHFNVAYKEKGDKINMDRWAKDLYAETSGIDPVSSVRADGYRATRISYIETSLLPIVIVFGKKVELGFGGYFGYGLSGKEKTDYTIYYDIPDLTSEGETFQSERPATFVSLIPESLEEGKLYLNRFDYGLMLHWGFRQDPLKFSLDFNTGLKQWAPDDELSGLFFNNLDKTYNLSGVLTVGWFF